MSFLNLFSPVCISHIANINAIDTVNSVVVVPLNNPVQITKTVNKNPALVGLLNVQLVSLEIQFIFVVTIGFLSESFEIKYPGNHIILKPNGIEHMIFHNGMFMVRARKKHAHKPIIVMPSIYSDINVMHIAKRNPKTIPAGLCIVLNSHI